MAGSPILKPASVGKATPEDRRWVVADRPGEGARTGTDAPVRAERDRRDAARAARGDVAAFSRLVESHSGLVHAVALRVLGAGDAQDASQEVWIGVWRNIKNFRGESAFTTWLYRITMNTCLSVRRKEARRTDHHDDEALFLTGLPDGEADPEASALGAERREEIGAALGGVRADHRAALVLRHMEGLSYSEIAKVLDVPNGTAKGWVSRGRDTMLVALAEAAPSRGPSGV